MFTKYLCGCLAPVSKIPCLTFEDILHIHSGYPKTCMHEEVDNFVRLVFSDADGNIEGDYLAHHTFDHKGIDLHNKGHLAVLGYVFQKYCSLDMMPVFRFFINLETAYGTNYGAYKTDLVRYFGVRPKRTSIGVQFKRTKASNCPLF